MSSPTQRALADLRKEFGCVAAITERWNPHARVRQDLFGFIDILALLGVNMLAIQVTSGTNHAARRKKIVDEPKARAWLMAGGLIEIWSYRKAKPRGERARWECRKEEIVLKDLEPVMESAEEEVA